MPTASSPPRPRRGGRDLDVAFQNAGTYPEARLTRLRPWLSELVSHLEPRASSLGVRLSGVRAMREINRTFRQVDGVTDVLSFPGGPTPEGWHVGDIVLCIPEARRQAERRGHSVEREIRVLLVHGVLHCLGYDHESDAGEMDALERRLRRRWIDMQ